MVDTRFYKMLGPFSLGELIGGLAAECLDSKFLDEKIVAGSALAKSVPGHISFLGSRRHKTALDTAKATACFVDDKFTSLVSEKHIIPIVSKTPRAHFARTLLKLYERRSLETETGDTKVSASASVHKTAVMGAGAVIGENSVIGPYAVIGPGVEVGSNTYIGSHVTVDCALIGDDCEIKSCASIGGRGFGVDKDEIGYVNIPHIGRVIIGDGVMIGSQTCVDRGQLGDTEIANDVKIDNLVQVAHNVRIGEGSLIAGHVGISGSCIIGEGVQLGGNVGLADHITIGDRASVAARAGVMHDIPPGEAWSGIPAVPFREHMRIINATRKLAQKPKKGGNGDKS